MDELRSYYGRSVESAEYLGACRETIYKWTEGKGMPDRRIGRYWKFKKDEADVWDKSGKAGE
jgi:phage transcriptional regulator, alpA